jgi:hypothetical protein
MPRIRQIFASMIKGNLVPIDFGLDIRVREAILKEGLPCIEFSLDEVNLMKRPFANYLIAKLSCVRPKLGMIWNIIKTSWGLKGAFSLGPIDSRHVVIRMMNDNDLYWLSLKIALGWMVKGSLFLWTPLFRPNKMVTKFGLVCHT